jgi:cell wall-associated NlpC family hydrolase
VEATLKKEQQTFEDKLAKALALLDTLKAEERAALERERAAREAASRSVARETLKQNTAAVAKGDPSSVPASGKGAIAVKFALAQVGEPYVYGGAGPDSWDCSGLTMMAWREAGVSLPHGAKAQLAVGPQISVGELQPGDLVYYYSPISHNGMYIGDGKIVHATHPGDVVSIDPLNSMPLTAASRPG